MDTGTPFPPQDDERGPIPLIPKTGQAQARNNLRPGTPKEPQRIVPPAQLSPITRPIIQPPRPAPSSAVSQDLVKTEPTPPPRPVIQKLTQSPAPSFVPPARAPLSALSQAPRPYISPIRTEQPPVRPVLKPQPIPPPPQPIFAPVQKPIPVPPPPQPQPIPPPPKPPIITPAVFETKPGLVIKPKRRITFGTWFTVLLIITTLIITVLYFWGASLERERSQESGALIIE